MTGNTWTHLDFHNFPLKKSRFLCAGVIRQAFSFKFLPLMTNKCYSSFSHNIYLKFENVLFCNSCFAILFRSAVLQYCFAEMFCNSCFAEMFRNSCCFTVLFHSVVSQCCFAIVVSQCPFAALFPNSCLAVLFRFHKVLKAKNSSHKAKELTVLYSQSMT